MSVARCATGRYSSHASLIFLLVSLALASFSVTSCARAHARPSTCALCVLLCHASMHTHAHRCHTLICASPCTRTRVGLGLTQSIHSGRHKGVIACSGQAATRQHTTRATALMQAHTRACAVGRVGHRRCTHLSCLLGHRQHVNELGVIQQIALAAGGHTQQRQQQRQRKPASPLSNACANSRARSSARNSGNRLIGGLASEGRCTAPVDHQCTLTA